MADPGRAVVQLRSVSKRYGRARPVLTDVSLTVRPAEILAVTGGNGSGKSTLLRLIAGVSRPSTGEYVCAAHIVGYVPERFPTHERMPATAYLRHMGRIRGLTTQAATRRADEFLDRLSLVGGADTPMRKLSKGNAQKIALAQALLVSPGLLILDEAWSGLDGSVHDTLGELISEAARDGSAVIFSDHGEAAACTWATRACQISGGRLGEASRCPATGGPGPAYLPALIQVDLTKPRVRADPEETPAWQDLPGVVNAEAHGQHVALHVSRESHDALLVTAITHGWSVTYVGPATTPPSHS